MPHDTTMTNMKIDPKAREKMTESVAADRPTYPWGLQVTLDNDALDKLSVDKLPQVGKSMLIYARVDVTSVSEHEASDGGKVRANRSVSLQITDLALMPDKKTTDAEGALYASAKT